MAIANPGDLSKIEAAGKTRFDLRSLKRSAIKNSTWRLVLSTSPTEPGLSRGVEMPDGRISVGGWSDLQPSTVLEDLGCQHIVLLTRPGAGGFELGVLRLLGLDSEQEQGMFDAEDPSSSFYTALEASDAIMCSDWDKPSVTDLDAMIGIGHDAPFQATAPFYTSNPVPTITNRVGLHGCTLGVPLA